MNPWFKDDVEEKEHLEMIQTPDMWPKSNHPHLCLKHPERMKDEGSQDTAFGVIVPESFDIYVGHGANRTLEHYASAEAIIEAGWVVD